jgi:putative ATP-dependent endonuclease of OLD family
MMKLSNISIKNFRRLESVAIDIEDKETIFVGPNNSGKTSATAIFRCFLGGRDFKIHDFSVARIDDFEKFAASGLAVDLPEIHLDLWFNIDPNSIAFGRVFTLLPKLSDFRRVGLRLAYGIDDAKKLRQSYFAAYPASTDGLRARSLFQYLATDSNLSRHSVVRYASLEEKKENDGTTIQVVAMALEPEEGKRLVRHLVRVDFVDAQRNINDDDSSRSNRLSTAFASFYRKNLEQAKYAAEAHAVIDENNKQLSAHYKVQFKPLFDLIKSLGVPSVNCYTWTQVGSMNYPNCTTVSVSRTSFTWLSRHATSIRNG